MSHFHHDFPMFSIYIIFSVGERSWRLTVCIYVYIDLPYKAGIWAILSARKAQGKILIALRMSSAAAR